MGRRRNDALNTIEYFASPLLLFLYSEFAILEVDANETNNFGGKVMLCRF